MGRVIGRGKKIHDCETQSPTRETRVLPGPHDGHPAIRLCRDQRFTHRLRRFNRREDLSPRNTPNTLNSERLFYFASFRVFRGQFNSGNANSFSSARRWLISPAFHGRRPQNSGTTRADDRHRASAPFDCTCPGDSDPQNLAGGAVRGRTASRQRVLL